jgi:hypothetical protein
MFWVVEYPTTQAYCCFCCYAAIAQAVTVMEKIKTVSVGHSQ